MARSITVTPVKTYATSANALKAINKHYADTDLRYLMLTTPEGRFYPVFLGERAVSAGVHFHFCVAN